MLNEPKPSREALKILLVSSIAIIIVSVPIYLYFTGYSENFNMPSPDPVLEWNGEPFRPVGVNYFPSTHPWTGMWTEFNETELAIDLDRLKAMGGNCLRTFLQWHLVEPEPGVFDQAIIDRVVTFFDVCSDADIVVIFTFFDWGPPSWANDSSNDMTFVDEYLIEREIVQLQTIIPLVSEKKAAFAWDLYNEPKSTRVTKAQFRSWVERLTATIREIDNTHLITVGGAYDNFENQMFFVDLVDFVSVHYFAYVVDPGWRESLPKYLEVFSRMGKPVVLEEFGMPSYEMENYTEEIQAEFYRDVFEICDRGHLAGVLAWCMWDYEPELWMERERHFGLLRVDGSWKPSAHVFHHYVTSGGL